MHRIRFIHAADLHLEQAFSGLTHIPPGMRDLLVDAPQQAAQKIFDAAIHQRVDLVILSGDVIDAEAAGPRAITFLLDEFEKLKQHNVAVYWATGDVDREQCWPGPIELPDNVYRFANKTVDIIEHSRDGQIVATLVGLSGVSSSKIRAKDLPSGNSDGCRIVAGHAETVPKQTAKSNIHYWAFGGRHQRDALDGQLHFAGTPQGRNPKESGPHGCNIVTIAGDGSCDVEFGETDVVRWEVKQLKINDSATMDEIKEQLGTRMLMLTDEASEQARLINWKILGLQSLDTSLSLSSIGDKLSDWLRHEFEEVSSKLWVVSVDVDAPTETPASWQNEETLLGEFIGAVRQLQDSESTPIELREFLSEELADSLSSTVKLTDAGRRRDVLRDAMTVGIDLLRGDDAA